LRRALEGDGHSVTLAYDGERALSLSRTEEIDVILLDLMLPRIDGFSVLKKLRSEQNRIAVIIVSARDALPEIVQGLDFGADDYLTKPFELAELEARLRALIRRSQGEGKSVVSLGPLSYESGGRMFHLHGVPLKLRPREHAVLEVLLLRAGKVVSKEALHEKIFDLDASASHESVEVYVHRLRKHLDRSGIAIVTIRGLGYTLETTG